MTKKEIIEYIDGELKLDVTVDSDNDTVWLTLDQMATLFGRNRSVIGKHIKNIMSEEYIDEINLGQKMPQINNSRGKKPIFYNLDVVISVGYRVKSKRGIAFRKWATEILKQYMIQGYAVNEKRLEILNRTIEFQNQIISNIASIAGMEGTDILDIVNSYSEALNLLDDYDHQNITKPNGRDTIYYLNNDDCLNVIEKTKFFGQSELFGKEREPGMLSGILNQIQLHIFGQELYPTVEEKAANLLYMLVKDHIYYDGNKRIAAIPFLEFLNRNQILIDEYGQKVISNGTLVAMTLMIACSKSEEKDIIVGLVMNLLKSPIINEEK